MRFGTGAQFGRIASGETPTPSPTPTPGPTLIDTVTGVAAFSASPWSTNNLALSSAGVVGPTGSGDATLLTSTSPSYDLLYRPSLGLRLARARVKSGTTDIFTLYMNTAAGSFPRINFNLAAGTFSNLGLGGGAMTALGGGWWLVEAQDTCNNFLGCGPDVLGANGVTVLLFDFSLYSVP